MPIALPPPIPPQQGNLAVLEERHATAQAQDRVVVLDKGRYDILVSGNTYLQPRRIKKIAAKGKTPTQKLLFLNALYLAQGHLLVNIRYARDGNTIYVQVNEGVIRHIQGPPALTPFFQQFKDVRNLNKSQLGPARVLAGLKASRAGYEVHLHYTAKPGQPSSYTLNIDTQPDPAHKSVESLLSFGNPGNRFLGRYFGLAQAKLNAPNGDVYGLSYARGFTSLGSSRGGDAYYRVQGSYSHINKFGVYGLVAAYTKYKAHNLFPTITDDHIKADILDIKLTGSQILFADQKTRLILVEQAGYIDSSRQLTKASGIPVGFDLLDEQYGKVKLGTTLTRSWLLFHRRGQFIGGLSYTHGIGGDIDDFNPFANQRTTNFGLFKTQLTNSYSIPRNLTLKFAMNGQYSTGDRLPQQEQWVLGGPGKLSAWLPGILVGDTGAFAKLSLQLPHWRVLGIPFQLSFYLEGGVAKFENVDPGLPDRVSATRSATDGGVKLEVDLLDQVSATLYAALPISHNNIDDAFADNTQSDLYFSLVAKW